MSFGSPENEKARAEAVRERALGFVPVLGERAADCERLRQLLPETIANIKAADRQKLC